MARRGRPIVIEWAADVRAFLRGTKGVERATEDIADELRDAAKDSDKFERDFSKSMKDAERQADRSSRKMGDDFDATGKRMGALGSEVGEEFVSNVGESVASGDVSGIVQDTIGGLVGKLKGPMAAAGAGLAGIAVLAFQRVQDQAQQVTDFVESWSDGLRDMIRMTADELNAAVVEEAYRDWIDDNQDLFDDMLPLIQQAGLDAETFARMLYSGDEGAQEVLRTLRLIRDQDSTRIKQGQRINVEYGKTGQAANDLLTNVQTLIRKQDDANESAANYSTLIGEDALGAVDAVKEAWADGLTDIDQRLQDLTKRREVWIDFKTTGGAAAYTTRGSANYSPAYVAIDNMHTGGRP